MKEKSSVIFTIYFFGHFLFPVTFPHHCAIVSSTSNNQLSVTATNSCQLSAQTHHFFRIFLLYLPYLHTFRLFVEFCQSHQTITRKAASYRGELDAAGDWWRCGLTGYRRGSECLREGRIDGRELGHCWVRGGRVGACPRLQ